MPFLFCLAWIVPGLIGHDPWKPDEGYSFGLVYELLKGGSWVVPTLAGEPFMEKPPLMYLTAAATASLFSPLLPLHDGARLASGLCMGLACLFVGLAGRELWGRGEGRIALALFLGSVGLLVSGHLLITDTALLAGVAAGLYGASLSLRREWLGGMWLGTGVGIGFMSKGLLACAILGGLALTLPLLDARWRGRPYLHFLSAAGSFSLPWLCIWPWALYRESQNLFGEWLWANNVGRFLGTNNLGPPAEPLHYLWVLPWFALPSLPLAIYGALACGRSGRLNTALTLPLAAALFMLAVLSASATARALYALPLLVPLALAGVPGARALSIRVSAALFGSQVFIFTIIIGTLWLSWLALELGAPAGLHDRLLAMSPNYVPRVDTGPLVIAVLSTVAWLWVVVELWRRRANPAYVWLLGITAGWGIAAMLLLGWADSSKTYRFVAHSIQRNLPPACTCIASFGLGEPQRALLHYFANIKTRRLEVDKTAGQCDVLLLQQRGKNIELPAGEWSFLWQGRRAGDRKEVFFLYQKKPTAVRMTTMHVPSVAP